MFGARRFVLAPATFEEFATSACDAALAMFRAVGNPDAGTDSSSARRSTKPFSAAIRPRQAAWRRPSRPSSKAVGRRRRKQQRGRRVSLR